ncbi:MAG: PEGA domain-containing protein, partial [FCB group bacterium]|nr:PEGA domain-containing protein [FCB group bacterium]
RENIPIETNPPGASVAFNNIPLPNITPLTLEDQPAGKHSIRLEKEGYGTLEETITVEKDKTVTKRFTLQKEYAGIKVTSDPPDATVYLDGDRLGETPLERNDISPGAGTLSLELEGYESNTQQVRLVAGQTKIFHVDLFRQTGSVSITANPYGAEVFLDGERLGVYKGTAFKRDKLNLGMHTARAVLDGYDDALESFNVMYNKTSQIELRPKAQPGSLFIMSTPSGASIIINDRDTNKNTSAKIDGLSAGEHDLILLLQGYGDVRKTVTVSPGKTETVNETLKETPQKIAGSSTLEEQKVTSPPPRKEPVSKFRSKIHRGITRKGFKLGFNLSKLVGADWSKNAKYKMGFCGGFFITYSFNKWFEIQPEILYTQKGEKYKDDYEESTEEFDYIEIPILTKFNFGIIKPIIGPAIAVNTRAKYKFEYYWTGQSGEVDETSHINSPDIGLILGAELSFGKFIFDARYNMGLIYVFKGFGWDNAKNSVFSSMMGYSF